MCQLQWQRQCLFLLPPLQTRAIIKQHQFDDGGCSVGTGMAMSQEFGVGMKEKEQPSGLQTLHGISLGQQCHIAVSAKESSKPAWRLCPCFVPSLRPWFCVVNTSTTVLPHRSCILAAGWSEHGCNPECITTAEGCCWLGGKMSGTYCDYTK